MKKIIVIFLIALLVLTSFMVANAEKAVTVEDLGVSFKIPSQVEWVTRTQGNYEIMENTYSMDKESLIAYMKSADEYFKGVDTGSDLRILLVCYPAEYSAMNFASRTNEDLMKEGKEAIEILGGTENDLIIYETDTTKFIQYKLNFVEEQSFYMCQTCVNGMIYMLNVRGTNDSYKETMALLLMETFSIENDKTSDVMSPKTISTSGATIHIPANWEEERVELYPDMESASYCNRNNDDGILRAISFNASDLYTLLGMNKNDAMRAFVSGDDYSEQIAILYGTEQNNISPEAIKQYTYGENHFYGYVLSEDDYSSIYMYIVENGYMYVFMFDTFASSNPFEDALYTVYENMLTTIEF